MITEEHVEIHISLWKSPPPPAEASTSSTSTTDPNTIIATEATSNTSNTITTDNNNNNNDDPIRTPMTIVEAQRRKGDSVIYYKYCRLLLSAANGTFHIPPVGGDTTSTNTNDNDANIATNNIQKSFQASSSIIEEIKHEKRQQQKQIQQQQQQIQQEEKDMMDKTTNNNNTTSFATEGEDSLLALEIAASLLKKDRMDARRLGMETLCLLTDPSKSGIQTALLASKVVLFGSIHAGHDESLHNDNDNDDDDDDDDEFDTMPSESHFLRSREELFDNFEYLRCAHFL